MAKNWSLTTKQKHLQQVDGLTDNGYMYAK